MSIAACWRASSRTTPRQTSVGLHTRQEAASGGVSALGTGAERACGYFSQLQRRAPDVRAGLSAHVEPAPARCRRQTYRRSAASASQRVGSSVNLFLTSYHLLLVQRAVPLLLYVGKEVRKGPGHKYLESRSLLSFGLSLVSVYPRVHIGVTRQGSALAKATFFGRN